MRTPTLHAYATQELSVLSASLIAYTTTKQAFARDEKTLTHIVAHQVYIIYTIATETTLKYLTNDSEAVGMKFIHPQRTGYLFFV